MPNFNHLHELASKRDAAPELYEALEELKDFVLTLTEQLDFGAWETTAKARAALAKARGEKPDANQ